MTTIQQISANDLCQHIDTDRLPFKTTESLEALQGLIGQRRAMEAINFGIGMKSAGYNMFALGPAGIGKHTAVDLLLENVRQDTSGVFDWCYVNNFKQATKPQLLKLPTGRGAKLRDDMQQLIDELHATIPIAFENRDYLAQVHQLEEEHEKKEAEAYEALQERAKNKNIRLMQRPGQFSFSPLKEGHVITPQEFEKLPQDERDRITHDLDELHQALQDLLEISVPKWNRELRETLKQLNEKTITIAVGQSIDMLSASYQDLPVVQEFLGNVKEDVVRNADDFRKSEGGGLEAIFRRTTSVTSRYSVNVLVDNTGVDKAPVIYEDRPSFNALIGRIEYESQLGTLITDFTHIQPGALHRANGGYLVLDARKLLTQPYAWEGLKRVLMAGEICIESLAQLLGLVNTVSLEPEPMPLNVKVILLGDRLLYYLLYAYDPDFSELFKVAADFDNSLQRSADNELLYARLIATLARKDSLRPFDVNAVARIIEISMRLVDDTQKLSMHVRSIVDLMQEADYWAGQNGRDTVLAEDVHKAWQSRIDRSSRSRELMHEAMQRGTLMIDTTGSETGQVNGLSVIELGDFSYGVPSRITATVRPGEGEMIDIERETELGGPLHSKGVFILSSFLGARYSYDMPLCLAASLTFEQSYSGVEGDSASLAELCALLSSLANLPIKQSIAVTGSVNQLGKVQPIGGVNDKIEGFFDVCQQRGLTGEQAVIIPATNREHLMLKQTIIDAVREGKFAIYAVTSVDEAIELLTGVPAGEADEEGKFPEGSVNHAVHTALYEFASIRQTFSEPARTKLQLIEMPEHAQSKKEQDAGKNKPD